MKFKKFVLSNYNDKSQKFIVFAEKKTTLGLWIIIRYLQIKLMQYLI